MKSDFRSVILPISVAVALGSCAGGPAAGAVEGLNDIPRAPLITNVAQFSSLSGVDYLAGCNFRLTGVVTLVDTNRDLVVLQDVTGAVALNFRLEESSLRVGQSVTLEGEGGSPYFSSFPDFPHRPAEWNVLTSFESLVDTNEYRLTRMRGFLCPPKTGEYSFWIASDNSSELWLSLNADPSKARKIASIPRFGWVSPREWTRYLSQHSEPVVLKAGEVYYIEAVSEQTTVGEHLEVAWQGPGLNQSVIDSPYLIPWHATGDAAHGVLRECWTNFSAGDLEGLTGPRVFESALSVEKVRVNVSGQGRMPKPERISLSEPLPAQVNYRWVQAEGFVKFAGTDGGVVSLELSDGQGMVQVWALHCDPEMARRLHNVPVRIEGVCEGVSGQSAQNQTLAPGLIWASTENCITFIETAATNVMVPATDRAAPSMTPTNPATHGFYGMRGVVTFNDRCFDKDFIFVQQDATAVLVAPGNRSLKRQLNVGQWVDLGGALEPGRYVPTITPLVVKEIGWHPMPFPISQPLSSPVPADREGRWSELEGVVQSVNSNGTLSVVGKDGAACLWMSQTPSNCLTSYVDARLRARGVLLLTLLDVPLLLCPSRDFVDVEEAAPADPFAAPRRPIAGLFPQSTEPSLSHRARIVGEVTYRDRQSFFIQDASGGVRVRTVNPPAVEVGKTVEVLAFPMVNDFVRTLTEALVRPATAVERVRSKNLDLSQPLPSDQSGTLVQINATLLSQRTNGTTQVLELEQQRRVFVATLAAGFGRVPNIPLESRLRITGVCNDETTAPSPSGDKPPKAQLPASLNILLRSPQDVALLSGPPWWTMKRTVTLVGTLLTVILVSLLWVHLLQRRLERQQAAQLAFSRQVLERLEDERRRIAVNLHDSLGQILLAIKNHALLAIQRPPDEDDLQQRLGEISGATSQAIEEVRQITHGLRPYQLDRLGLTQAIRTSVGRATANNSISFAIRVEDIDGLFDKDAEIHVYRVVQEAVTNVVKHSAATEAAVVIKKRSAAVTLSIRDNGKGFDPAKLFSRPHDLGYGLSGIAERVRILAGTLAINSRPGEGTSLTVEIPAPIRTHDTGSNTADRG